MEPASTEPVLVEPGHGILRGTTVEPASAELRLRVQLRILQALSLLRVQLCVLQALSQNMSGGMPQPRPNSDGGHYNIWVRVRSK